MKCNMQNHSCRMKIKSFKCTICQEKFSEEIAMTNHIQSHVKLTNLDAVSWNTLYYYTNVKSTAWTEEVMLWSIPLSFLICVRIFDQCFVTLNLILTVWPTKSVMFGSSCTQFWLLAGGAARRAKKHACKRKPLGIDTFGGLDCMYL